MNLPDFRYQRNGYRVGEFFWLWEFECPCCLAVKAHPNLVRALDEIRKERGPIHVTSGYRCLAHQAEVYEKKNLVRAKRNLPPLTPPATSPHVQGQAVDIPLVFEGAAEDWLRGLGITGVGHGIGWTHLDVFHSNFRVWGYDD
jgi:uncharacterized protein YcbK (DUF882 family)